MQSYQLIDWHSHNNREEQEQHCPSCRGQRGWPEHPPSLRQSIALQRGCCWSGGGGGGSNKDDWREVKSETKVRHLHAATKEAQLLFASVGDLQYNTVTLPVVRVFRCKRCRIRTRDDCSTTSEPLHLQISYYFIKFYILVFLNSIAKSFNNFVFKNLSNNSSKKYWIIYFLFPHENSCKTCLVRHDPNSLISYCGCCK